MDKNITSFRVQIKTDDEAAPYIFILHEDCPIEEATWAEIFCGETKQQACGRMLNMLPDLLCL